jgi:small-conductance mechanosensitive channel
MRFNEIFKNSNDYNEKTIIGFMSFAVMTLAMIVDLVTGYFGNELKLNEYIYNSFVIVTLGSFGIAGLEKFAGKNNNNQNNNEEELG